MALSPAASLANISASNSLNSSMDKESLDRSRRISEMFSPSALGRTRASTRAHTFAQSQVAKSPSRSASLSAAASPLRPSASGNVSDLSSPASASKSPRGRARQSVNRRMTASPSDIAALAAFLGDDSGADNENEPSDASGRVSSVSSASKAASADVEEPSTPPRRTPLPATAASPAPNATDASIVPDSAQRKPAHRHRTPARSILVSGPHVAVSASTAAAAPVNTSTVTDAGPATQARRRGVVFGSPTAAEFSREAPSSTLRALDRSTVRANFKLPSPEDAAAATTAGSISFTGAAAATAMEDDSSSIESAETSMNSSILAAWEDEVASLEPNAMAKKSARARRSSTRKTTRDESEQLQGDAMDEDDATAASPAVSSAPSKRSRRQSYMPTETEIVSALNTDTDALNASGASFVIPSPLPTTPGEAVAAESTRTPSATPGFDGDAMDEEPGVVPPAPASTPVRSAQRPPLTPQSKSRTASVASQPPATAIEFSPRRSPRLAATVPAAADIPAAALPAPAPETTKPAAKGIAGVSQLRRRATIATFQRNAVQLHQEAGHATQRTAAEDAALPPLGVQTPGNTEAPQDRRLSYVIPSPISATPLPAAPATGERKANMRGTTPTTFAAPAAAPTNRVLDTSAGMLAASTISSIDRTANTAEMAALFLALDGNDTMRTHAVPSAPPSAARAPTSTALRGEDMELTGEVQDMGQVTAVIANLSELNDSSASGHAAAFAQEWQHVAHDATVSLPTTLGELLSRDAVQPASTNVSTASGSMPQSLSALLRAETSGSWPQSVVDRSATVTVQLPGSLAELVALNASERSRRIASPAVEHTSANVSRMTANSRKSNMPDDVGVRFAAAADDVTANIGSLADLLADDAREAAEGISSRRLSRLSHSMVALASEDETADNIGMDVSGYTDARSVGAAATPVQQSSPVAAVDAAAEEEELSLLAQCGVTPNRSLMSTASRISEDDRAAAPTASAVPAALMDILNAPAAFRVVEQRESAALPVPSGAAVMARAAYASAAAVPVAAPVVRPGTPSRNVLERAIARSARKPFTPRAGQQVAPQVSAILAAAPTTISFDDFCRATGMSFAPPTAQNKANDTTTFAAQCISTAAHATAPDAVLRSKLTNAACIQPEIRSCAWAAQAVRDTVATIEPTVQASIARLADLPQPFVFAAAHQAVSIIAARQRGVAGIDDALVDEARDLLHRITSLKALHDQEARVAWLVWRRKIAAKLLTELRSYAQALHADVATLTTEYASINAVRQRLSQAASTQQQTVARAMSLASVAHEVQSGAQSLAAALSTLLQARAAQEATTSSLAAITARRDELAAAISKQEEEMSSATQAAEAALEAEAAAKRDGVTESRLSHAASAAETARAHYGRVCSQLGWRVGQVAGDRVVLSHTARDSRETRVSVQRDASGWAVAGTEQLDGADAGAFWSRSTTRFRLTCASNLLAGLTSHADVPLPQRLHAAAFAIDSIVELCNALTALHDRYSVAIMQRTAGFVIAFVIQRGGPEIRAVVELDISSTWEGTAAGQARLSLAWPVSVTWMRGPSHMHTELDRAMHAAVQAHSRSAPSAGAMLNRVVEELEVVLAAM